MRASVPPKLWLVSAAISGTLAIAGCGSSGPSSTGTAAGPSIVAKLDKFAACMRHQGVSGFPDPSTSETPNSFGIDGYDFDLPSSINSQSPAYESADKTCERFIGSGTSGGPHLDLARARKAALAHAACMREHGVPNFPDPTVTGNGQGVTVKSGGPGISPQSPAFHKAQKLCGGG
jgi:hypothetical protein